jgi:hypothetical protein
MFTFICPQCGGALNEMPLGEFRCQSCGATLPAELPGQAASVEKAQDSEHVAEIHLWPKHSASPLPPEPTTPEVKIRRSDHTETLAVLALLLPLVAQGLALACRFDSWRIQMALSWGTIVVTALVLAVDAAFLGTKDLQGTHRNGPVAVFFGMLFIWIIGYPLAFFRRRHFGQPNLGPLAILVAGFFVAVPFVQQYMASRVVGGDVATCTSAEVKAMVEDMIRQSPKGQLVQSVGQYRETHYDRATQTRTGECQVKTTTGEFAVTY